MSQFAGSPLTANNLFPLGSNPTSSPAQTVNQWPLGGQAAATTSTPLTSGANNPDYWLPIWSGEIGRAHV